MAGMKRKAQSAPASPVNKRDAKASQKADARKSKKAKVEEKIEKVEKVKAVKAPKVEKVFDPTEEPLNELINSLNGPLGNELTAEVLAMTKDIVNDALAAFVEDRSTLHTAYVSLVGECFSTATAALGEKAAAAAADLDEAESVNFANVSSVEAAKMNLSLCEHATSEAKKELVEAEAAKDKTVSELDAQNKELANLEKAKDKQVKIATDMASSLELVMSPEATAKDGKKVCDSLKSIGASESMLKSVTPALGHWNLEGFEAMILQQAAKVISAKADEVNSVLADWDNHCSTMQAEGQRLETLLAANNSTIEECNAEIETTTANQKEANIGVKEAEATQKKQQKIVNSKMKAKDEADGIVSDAEMAGKAFEFLQIRTAIVPEEPVVVAEVETEESAVATEVEKPLVEDVEMAEPVAASPIKEPTPVKLASPIKESTPVKAPTPVKAATPVPEPTAFVAPEETMAPEPTPAKNLNGLVYEYGSPTPMKPGQEAAAPLQSPGRRLSSHGA